MGFMKQEIWEPEDRGLDLKPSLEAIHKFISELRTMLITRTFNGFLNRNELLCTILI